MEQGERIEFRIEFRLGVFKESLSNKALFLLT